MSEDPPSGSLEAERLAATLRAEIQKLPARCRMAFILYTWHSLSPLEIVARMASEGVTLDVCEVRKYLLFAAWHLRDVIEQSQSVISGARKTRPKPVPHSVDESLIYPIGTGTPHKPA